MKVYRQGAVKLVNSLSRSSDVVRLETIDPDAAIIRFNLDDLGWAGAGLGQRARGLSLQHAAATPSSPTRCRARPARSCPTCAPTGSPSRRPRRRSTTSCSSLPRTFQALAHEQGVDVEGNIKKFLAQRSGFQKSGVSQNNRLIERHPRAAATSGRPTTSPATRRARACSSSRSGRAAKDGFEHDGGETIFSLPNGFQGYYLNEAKGDSARQGPDRDRARPVAQGPGGHQRHLLHGLPRPGHAQGQGRGARQSS